MFGSSKRLSKNQINIHGCNEDIIIWDYLIICYFVLAIRFILKAHRQFQLID